MSNSKLIHKWQQARDDLGLRITAPAEIDLGNGDTIRADVLLLDFGAKNGMIVITDFNLVKRHLETLQRLGYGFSVLNEPRDAYNREGFIDMLSDWGWSGNQPAPDWVKEVDDD